MVTNACELTSQRCEPCEGGQPTLTRDQVTPLLEQLDAGWAVDSGGSSISRDFRFKGFNKTMSFVNAVAWIANQQMHHPDLQVGYDHCEVTLTTHAIDGLSANDFIVAAKIDQLFA